MEIQFTSIEQHLAASVVSSAGFVCFHACLLLDCFVFTDRSLQLVL